MDEKNKYKEALELAGKLALSSEAVIKSDIFTLYDNLRQLDKDLSHYNKYIFDWSLKKG